ncbi:hypothetical protein CDD81_5798 [Ophiocordyceps australis]|uniref:Tse2 ADP-ribosyltransferase toxin domain-containing protein n=1 Tax=Ophiocordyceps australis TaxID=1399860 RepID=A0A2C5Y485_9HYPO|nr:hypothetical protein CDD81_5798 [Ophiocordyceps australis]
MLRRAGRIRRVLARRPQVRNFSIRGVYTSFPATLLYYSPLPKISLYKYTGNEDKDNVPLDDAVVPAADDLVYPTVLARNAFPYSNGAVLLPNTAMMQTDLRVYFSEFLKYNKGLQIELEPRILTIRKGTAVPSTLILFHEISSRFSLQPRLGLTVKDLNLELEKFFYIHAEKEGIRPWLQRNAFMFAAKDKDESTWMGR